MSRRDSIIRYGLIIRKIRRQPFTFKEIESHLSLESEIQGINLTTSKRTFHRDLNDIRLIYSIDIVYDFSKGVYLIETDKQDEKTERMLEAFDLFHTLNLTERFTDIIHFEKRRSKGTEHLWFLKDSIQRKKMICFDYNGFWQKETTFRRVKPLALKEFRSRWYLLADEPKSRKIKTFALDRLESPRITNTNFKSPNDFSVDDYFKHSFGIISCGDQIPQKVILSFEPQQGNYLKSLPLHESQQILIDSDEEFVVRLTLCITYDFLKELLSYGPTVKVLEPTELAETFKKTYKKAFKIYSKNIKPNMVITLNELLEKEDIEENELKKILIKEIEGSKYLISLVDLELSSPEALEEAKRMKEQAFKQNNFKEAALYRKLEKIGIEQIKLAKDHNIQISTFILEENIMTYYHKGNAVNDRLVLKHLGQIMGLVQK